MLFYKPLTQLVLVAIALGQGTWTGAAHAADFTLEASHTALIFGISHMGYSITYGRFNNVSGTFSFDKAAPEQSRFNITIDATSIDTNDQKRDQHLSSPDFFDVRQFPTITFVSSGASVNAAGQPNGNEIILTGQLTMHGVTRDVSIPIVYLGEGQGPYGDYRCGFSSQFKVKRSDFGMKGMVPAIGDEVAITFSFEGIRNP